MGTGGKMNWKINKNWGSFHFHDPIYVDVPSPQCILCKEMKPNHIMLQEKLLNINSAVYACFLDFYISDLSEPEPNWNYYHLPTKTLHIEHVKDRDLQKSIINVFKQFLSDEFSIEYP